MICGRNRYRIFTVWIVWFAFKCRNIADLLYKERKCEWKMMRAMHKRMTWEDKFDRKYRCNVYRFLPYMKKSNNKKFRRIIKEDTKNMSYFDNWRYLLVNSWKRDFIAILMSLNGYIKPFTKGKKTWKILHF